MRRTLRIAAVLVGIGAACATALVLGVGAYLVAWHNGAL